MVRVNDVGGKSEVIVKIGLIALVAGSEMNPGQIELPHAPIAPVTFGGDNWKLVVATGGSGRFCPNPNTKESSIVVSCVTIDIRLVLLMRVPSVIVEEILYPVHEVSDTEIFGNDE